MPHVTAENVLILRQLTERMHSKGGVWQPDQWSCGVEAEGGNYARLDQLEQFRNSDELLELELRWPGSHLEPQRWLQQSNPYLKRSRGVKGYQPIDCPNTQCGWSGIQFDGGKRNSLLSGSSASWCKTTKWFYAVGAYRLWKEGFPGPDGSIVVHHVELWVRNPAANPAWASPAHSVVSIDLPEESPDQALQLLHCWQQELVGLLTHRTNGFIKDQAAYKLIVSWIFETSTLPAREGLCILRPFESVFIISTSTHPLSDLDTLTLTSARPLSHSGLVAQIKKTE